MSNSVANPLAKHFRQPALYLKLPSNGRWYPEGTLDLPVTGEIPVYPMTAKDEIMFKTPDALMNGTSTMEVIQSCCPSIKNAWKMPAIDIDPVLIAIRLATYGKEMDFTSVCPHCGTKNEKALDLTFMLDKITPADWGTPVEVDGLQIILKPQTYEDFNKNSIINFEEQRIMQLVQSDEMSADEKTERFNDMFKRLIETGVNQVSKSIAGIKIEDGSVVDNTDFIKEFLENCERHVWESIKEKLDEIKRVNSGYNNIDTTCENEECAKIFTTPFVFEQSSFFA
jgi:hypothetical protein